MKNVSESFVGLALKFKHILGECGIAFKNKEQLLFCLLDGALTPIEVLERMNINRPNLTHLTNAMQKSGLIKKLPSQKDLRQIKYELTQKGKEEINSITAVLEARIKQVFSDEDYSKLNKNIISVEEAISFL